MKGDFHILNNENYQSQESNTLIYELDGTIRRAYRPRHSLLWVLPRIGRPLLPEIPRHGLYLYTHGFQLFQRPCQTVPAVHVQRASGVEVVSQIVELISDLAVLIDESKQFRRYHGNLLPADRPPLSEQLPEILAGRHIAHDRFIQ